MTHASTKPGGSAKDAGQALALFLLIGILIGLGCHAYWVWPNSIASYPFMHEFREATLVVWSADWLVFLFVLVHAVRLAFGVLFLMHDDSLLATFDLAKPSHRFFKKALFVFAIALFLSLVVLVLAMRYEILRGVLLTQGAMLLVFDVVYFRWLIMKDKDWRWNVLILIGDAAFGVFLVLEGKFLNERGPVLLEWFGLAVYTVATLHILILVLEVPFTYGNAIRNAARNLGSVVVICGVSIWGAISALFWPKGGAHVDKN